MLNKVASQASHISRTPRTALFHAIFTEIKSNLNKYENLSCANIWLKGRGTFFWWVTLVKRPLAVCIFSLFFVKKNAFKILLLKGTFAFTPIPTSPLMHSTTYGQAGTKPHNSVNSRGSGTDLVYGKGWA